MILGILPPLGGSLKDMAKYGQDERFLKYYAGKYCKEFDQVLYFSYSAEHRSDLLNNFKIIQPTNGLHRYIYGFLLPILRSKEYRQCDVVRAIHLSGSIPAVIGKVFYGKKFVVNYNYDYKKWAEIEGKSYLIPLIKILELIAFKTADFVFVADEQMQIYIRQFRPMDKIVVIRNGVDVDLFKPRPKSFDQNNLTILSVGRLEKQKNYELLVEGVSLCKHKIKVIIVGRGSLKQGLETLARKLNVNLKIIESAPHTSLPKIYQSADIYLQTSLAEAPLKTLLEAMSCAVPCIGTDVAGIRSVIENKRDGLLSQPTAEKVAESLELLISNSKLRREISPNAREKITNKYNLKEMIEKEVDILKKL